MLAFEFDRAGIRQQYKTCRVILLSFALCGVLWGVFLTHHLFWACNLLGILVLVTVFSSSAFVRRHDLLARCWKRQEPALIVNPEGIIVNALSQPSGQIAWQDIEKMYPTELTERLFRSIWQKMPVVSKQRGLAIILKAGTDFQRRYRDSGIWKVEWLFIPETLLTTTADDVMVRLNKFYVTQVREAH